MFYSNNTKYGLVGSFTQDGSGSSFEKILLQQPYYIEFKKRSLKKNFHLIFLFIKKTYIYMGILFSMIYTYLEISNISNTDVLFR